MGAAGGDGEAAEHEPGLAELSTVSVLNNEWQAISIEQRGPDGTEVIGMVIFYSCPVCNAVVAPPAGGINFPQEHAEWHVKQARDWDHVNTVIATFQQAGTE